MYFFRFGSGHDRYTGDVDAETAKEVFELAIEKYFDDIVKKIKKVV